jgi:outer membrane protein assembly factor BamE (lipoprotein component of BamABCDE complex)
MIKKYQSLSFFKTTIKSRKYFFTVIAAVNAVLIAGCTSKTAPVAAIPARQVESQKITVGSAQTLKVGMGGAEVISSLGTPNIITTDTKGVETWVYDKISNEYEFITVQDNGWIFNPRQRSSGVEVRSQRTLIVVIKFNKDSKIDSIQYRQTAY